MYIFSKKNVSFGCSIAVTCTCDLWNVTCERNPSSTEWFFILFQLWGTMNTPQYLLCCVHPSFKNAKLITETSELMLRTAPYFNNKDKINCLFGFNAPFHCFEQVIIFNNVSKCSVEWNNRSLLKSLRWSSRSLFRK